MDFFNYKTKVKPTSGRLLVSEPHLPDPNFERTIILLCEHNVEGSFGFVLNKPSIIQISDVLEDINVPGALAFIGGPVQQDTLHFVHRYEDLEGSCEVLPGVYWGGDFEKLKFLAQTREMTTADIKFFLGYSGWSAGQLNDELEENSWIVSDRVNGELIFETNPGIMWQKALKFLGGRFSVYSNYPADPRMN